MNEKSMSETAGLATSRQREGQQPTERRQYIIRGGVQGRERLRIMARVLRPGTLMLLHRAGIKPGMTCLDAGCGGGDTSFDLAELVGPQGRVLGLDLDETKLTLARHEAELRHLYNVQFRLSDIAQSEELPKFDLVYARFLLTHMSDPTAIARRMRTLLYPGGVLVLEDIDFTGYFCHPHSAALGRYVELYNQAVKLRDGDPNIGPRLPGILLDLGFERVQVQVVQPVALEGEVKLVTPLTMESIQDCLLEEGLSSKEEIAQIIDELYRFAQDPKALASFPRVIQTWGYRSQEGFAATTGEGDQI